MELGEKVIYYTHDMSDLNHSTVDQVAIVLREVSDVAVDLAVFPVGGPVIFCRAEVFDPEWPYSPSGGTYWRPAGEEAPDFGDYFAYANDPDWVRMQARMRREYDAANPEDRDDIVDKHRQEVANMRAQLAKRYHKTQGDAP